MLCLNIQIGFIVIFDPHNQPHYNQWPQSVQFHITRSSGSQYTKGSANMIYNRSDCLRLQV